MTAANLFPQIASLVYSASTSLIRFLYVRSSLQENIQEVYRRNQFTLLFVAIGEGINILNIICSSNNKKSEIFKILRNLNYAQKEICSKPIRLF